MARFTVQILCYIHLMFVAQVTQIPCGCSNTTGAPDGCLQYYSGISGNIKSFNYDNVGNRLNMDLDLQSLVGFHVT